MKQKQLVMTIFAAVMTTYSYADVIPVALYGNTAPLYLADASSSMAQPGIKGVTAAGENQTTIIDGNGNLKIIDKAAEPAASAPQGATSNNMSGSNPGATTRNEPGFAPNAGSSSTAPNMNTNTGGSVPGSLPGNAMGTNPGMAPSNPPATNPGVAPSNLPGTAPGIAPNNVPGATPGIEPGVAPGVGR